MTITPERIAELRGLCNVPSAEMVARARLRTFRKRTDALTTLGLALHALPALLDEIERLRDDARHCAAVCHPATAEVERLRAVIRETHTDQCEEWVRGRPSARHLPGCKLYEIEP